MFGKYAVRISIAVASLVVGPFVLADEVVQFTNGAEMTVQSHVVEKDMVKLDLGGNNSISFPVSMVSKIVSAGKDVFRNPVYYPTNQAIAGPATNGTPAFATTTGPAGARVRQAVPGQAGMRLGEAGDRFDPNDSSYGSGAITTRSNPHDDTSVAGKSRLDQRRALPSGGVATIDPPGAHWPVGKVAPQMSPRAAPPPAANPQSNPNQGPSEGPATSPQDGNAGQAQDEQAPSDDAGTEPPPEPPPHQP